MNLLREFNKGIFRENPIFRLVLGMCPTLAVTTSLENAIGMGLASSFVLLGSNIVVSSIRHVVPEKVRIPCYIVVIATFVTMVEMLLKAYAPALSESLGIFIPLIVVNCIILGRAEAFASRHSLGMSVADGLGMGLGFTLSLMLLGACREMVGAGTLTLWAGIRVLDLHVSSPVILAVLAPGGFLALGLLLGLINALQAWHARRSGKTLPLPPELDCRHCVLGNVCKSPGAERKESCAG